MTLIYIIYLNYNSMYCAMDVIYNILLIAVYIYLFLFYILVVHIYKTHIVSSLCNLSICN